MILNAFLLTSDPKHGRVPGGHWCMNVLKLELWMSHAGRVCLSAKAGGGGYGKGGLHLRNWAWKCRGRGGEGLPVLCILDFCCSAGSKNTNLMVMLFSITAGQESTAADHLTSLFGPRLWSFTTTFLTELQKPRLRFGVFCLGFWLLVSLGSLSD